MRSKMTIKVEFLAGTELKEAIEEAKKKARLWDVCYVCFNFNGIRFSISQDADVDKLFTCGKLKMLNTALLFKEGICLHTSL